MAAGIDEGTSPVTPRGALGQGRGGPRVPSSSIRAIGVGMIRDLGDQGEERPPRLSGGDMGKAFAAHDLPLDEEGRVRHGWLKGVGSWPSLE